MDDDLRVNERITIPLAEIDVRASRSSGPGGQHSNVTASRIEASLDLEQTSALDAAQRSRAIARLGPRVTAVAQDTRSQARNRQLALQRLAQRLDRALRVTRPRKATRPTRGSRERRLAAKRQRGERKQTRRRPDRGDW